MSVAPLHPLISLSNATLTYTVGGMGLVNGDTLSGDLTTGAGNNSFPGPYSIDQGTLAASGNYAVTLVGGVLYVYPSIAGIPFLVSAGQIAGKPMGPGLLGSNPANAAPGQLWPLFSGDAARFEFSLRFPWLKCGDRQICRFEFENFGVAPST